MDKTLAEKVLAAMASSEDLPEMSLDEMIEWADDVGKRLERKRQ